MKKGYYMYVIVSPRENWIKTFPEMKLYVITLCDTRQEAQLLLGDRAVA